MATKAHLENKPPLVKVVTLPPSLEFHLRDLNKYKQSNKHYMFYRVLWTKKKITLLNNLLAKAKENLVCLYFLSSQNIRSSGGDLTYLTKRFVLISFSTLAFLESFGAGGRKKSIKQERMKKLEKGNKYSKNILVFETHLSYSRFYDDLDENLSTDWGWRLKLSSVTIRQDDLFPVPGSQSAHQVSYALKFLIS